MFLYRVSSCESHEWPNTYFFPPRPSSEALGSFKGPKHSSIKGPATETNAYLVTSATGTKDWHQAAPRRAAVITWPSILFGFSCCRREVNLLAPALCGSAIGVSEWVVEEKGNRGFKTTYRQMKPHLKFFSSWTWKILCCQDVLEIKPHTVYRYYCFFFI